MSMFVLMDGWMDYNVCKFMCVHACKHACTHV